jgi:hypothetical protein
MQTVHVRVNDAATGRPTPVRVRFASPSGEYFAPLGRLARFAVDTGVDVGGNLLLGGKEYAYIDGTFEVRLPAGPVTVEISKGPEYRPVASTVTLPPGKLALRFEVERWIDLRAQQWYSGDTRCHHMTPHGCLLEAAAEDIAVVNLLASQDLVWGEQGKRYPAIPNMLAFSGQRPALEAPGHLVVVNTLNVHPVLGRLILLNCHRPVFPLHFGGPETGDNWTLAAWCDQCHRKGGLVVGDNFFGHPPGHPHGELLADLILGKIDALQLDGFKNPAIDAELQQASVLEEWCGLLNCGFRIPLVGGSGKDSNLGVLGCPRTYARLQPDQEFTYQNWIEAVRAGRTFVTDGPMLFLNVNGQDPGAVIELPASAPVVRFHAEARSLAPFDRLEVVANGKVVARAEPAGSPASAVVHGEVPMPEGGWLTARCWGPYDHTMEQWIAAQASPIYVHVNGRPPRPDAAAVTAFTGRLDQMLDWVAHQGRFANDQQRDHLAGIFRSAKSVLADRLSIEPTGQDSGPPTH